MVCVELTGCLVTMTFAWLACLELAVTLHCTVLVKGTVCLLQSVLGGENGVRTGCLLTGFT
jgi:hypothetical protein